MSTVIDTIFTISTALTTVCVIAIVCANAYAMLVNLLRGDDEL